MAQERMQCQSERLNDASRERRESDRQNAETVAQAKQVAQDHGIHQLAAFDSAQSPEIVTTHELLHRLRVASQGLQKLTGRNLEVDLRNGVVSIWERTQ